MRSALALLVGMLPATALSLADISRADGSGGLREALAQGAAKAIDAAAAGWFSGQSKSRDCLAGKRRRFSAH